MVRFLLLLFLALSSLSCTTKTEPESTTISFWHFWSEPSQKQVLRGLLDQFEKENNCTIQTTELTWNDGKTKLIAAFSSNTAPDLLELGSDWIAQFSSAGVLRDIPLDSLQRFVEQSRRPVMWRGQAFAYPWTIDTRVLFMNCDIIEKAGLPCEGPATLDAMASNVRMLSEKTELASFGANGPDPHRLYKKILPIIWAYGGDILSENRIPTFNWSENVRAIEYYASLARLGVIESQRQLDMMFAQGKVAYWFSGAWLIEKIAKTNPTMRFKCALIPGTNAGSSASFAGGEYLAVNAKSKNDALAQKLAQWLTSKQAALTLCKAIPEAGLPADKGGNADTYFQGIAHRPVFIQQLASARMTPVHPKWLDLEGILEKAVEEVMLGRMDAATALANAQAEAETLLGPIANN